MNTKYIKGFILILLREKLNKTRKPLDWRSAFSLHLELFFKMVDKQWLLQTPNNARHKIAQVLRKNARGRLWIVGRLVCSASLSLLLVLRGEGVELACCLPEASLDATAAWPRPHQGHAARCCRI